MTACDTRKNMVGQNFYHHTILKPFHKSYTQIIMNAVYKSTFIRTKIIWHCPWRRMAKIHTVILCALVCGCVCSCVCSWVFGYGCLCLSEGIHFIPYDGFCITQLHNDKWQNTYDIRQTKKIYTVHTYKVPTIKFRIKI